MSHKKILIFLSLIFFAHVAFAYQTEFCPSVAEIKNGSLTYWLPLYKDNEELASTQDVETFKEHVSAFVVARWAKDYDENGHCFYQGDDPILDRIVFARDAWQPVLTGKWDWVTPRFLAECYSSDVKDCGFIQ